MHRAAFGVMMWEAATGSAAFKELHYGGFYQAVVVEGARPPLPPALDPDYAALMQAVSGSWLMMGCKALYSGQNQADQPGHLQG
jgi:hypothetical protein